jgi:hypothetical protein
MQVCVYLYLLTTYEDINFYGTFAFLTDLPTILKTLIPYIYLYIR